MGASRALKDAIVLQRHVALVPHGSATWLLHASRCAAGVMVVTWHTCRAISLVSRTHAGGLGAGASPAGLCVGACCGRCGCGCCLPPGCQQRGRACLWSCPEEHCERAALMLCLQARSGGTVGTQIVLASKHNPLSAHFTHSSLALLRNRMSEVLGCTKAIISHTYRLSLAVVDDAWMVRVTVCQP